jgi:hypothetical protein
LPVKRKWRQHAMHGHSLGVEASYWNKEKGQRRLHCCCIYATIFDVGAILREEEKKGDIGFDFEDEVAALAIWTLDVQEFVLFVWVVCSNCF